MIDTKSIRFPTHSIQNVIHPKEIDKDPHQKKEKEEKKKEKNLDTVSLSSSDTIITNNINTGVQANPINEQIDTIEETGFNLDIIVE